MNDFESRARRAADAVNDQLNESAGPDVEAGLRQVKRSPRAGRTVLRLSAAAALVAGIAIVGPRLTDNGRPVLGGSGVAYAQPGRLQQFGDCEATLAYFKEHAADYLISQAARPRMYDTAGGAERAPAGSVPDAIPAASGADSSTAAESHSTTNVQEAGVDEPDLIKTDGKRIVAVSNGRVHLISTDHGHLKQRAKLPVTDVRDVFLTGNRLVVFGEQAGSGAWQPREPMPSGPVGGLGAPWVGGRSAITVYDISSLSKPVRISKLSLDGEVLDARMIGSQVRVVTSSTPDVNVASPTYDSDGKISEKSKAQLQAAVAKTGVDDWIPSYRLTNGAGATLSSGRLVDCTDLSHPENFSGLDTVAVLSFDAGTGPRAQSAAGVVASGEQIYATSNATYVSSTDWSETGAPATTAVHKFGTAAAGKTVYRGSGVVPGSLLNQYSMSELDGVLRVATTVSENRGWVSSRQISEGVVTTLREQDGALQQIGQVGGLGRDDNESIQSVRFIGDRGYVVTYRRTDPLYVIDLHDPTAPEVVGELKIPGYSGYLHPIGKNLLLGVGQGELAAGKGGSSEPGGLGVQFSLFDISNPAAPRRIDTQTYGSGMAGAEFDPKAFLYWQPSDLVLAPISLYGDFKAGKDRGAFQGVVALRVGPGGLQEVGKLSTAADQYALRSVIIGKQVYLLSDGALKSASLGTYRQIDRLTF